MGGVLFVCLPLENKKKGIVMGCTDANVSEIPGKIQGLLLSAFHLCKLKGENFERSTEIKIITVYHGMCMVLLMNHHFKNLVLFSFGFFMASLEMYVKFGSHEVSAHVNYNIHLFELGPMKKVTEINH